MGKHEDDGDDEPEEERGGREMTEQGAHERIMRGVRSASTAFALRTSFGASIGALLLVVCACGAAPSRDGIAVMASGADLESGNPVVTIHSLARQVQRHALFVTLARYDSALAPEPY